MISAFMVPPEPEKKPKYIDCEAAYPLAKKICDAIDSEDFQRLNFGMRILDWIDDIPAADVRPVVKAKWVYTDMSRLVCSNCGNPAAFSLKEDGWHHGDFCPNCGAMMEEET